MAKSDMMEMALEKLLGDMDDLEGSAAMAHSAEDCPDPLGCKMHDDELGEHLSPGDKPGEPAEGVEIEIKKIGPGMPSMEGAKDEPSVDDLGQHGEGLSEEDAEELRKLLK